MVSTSWHDGAGVRIGAADLTKDYASTGQKSPPRRTRYGFILSVALAAMLVCGLCERSIHDMYDYYLEQRLGYYKKYYDYNYYYYRRPTIQVVGALFVIARNLVCVTSMTLACGFVFFENKSRCA